MSEQSPPNPYPLNPVFNPNDWIFGFEALTIAEADKRYLKYPNAQGTENLQAINVSGLATFNNTMVVNGSSSFIGVPTFSGSSIFNGVPTFNASSIFNGIPTFNNQVYMNDRLTMTSPDPSKRVINTSWVQFSNENNLATNAGIIWGSQNDMYYEVYTAGNSHIMQTNNGQGATPTLQLNDGTKNIYFLANAGAGSYNPATNAGNEVILAKGSSSNTETLELTTWSATNSSVKIAPTSVSMGAGGTSATPTTSVACNGTSVVISPSITFPDNRVQNSAFTGAGALSGSYTLSNITLDANGKITAISSGSSTNQFQPLFHNLANYQTGTSGYSQGAYINWSSGWGALDYVIIRVRAQVNWSISSGEYNNYATTAGELIIRPHYATAGVMGSLSSPNQFWSTNSGSLFGNVKKLLYYTGAVNNGSQGYFFVYGNGGSGGGASGYIQLMCDATGTANGWQYTCTYEYLVHSTSGGSITFTNGAGGGTATTNNSLP